MAERLSAAAQKVVDCHTCLFLELESQTDADFVDIEFEDEDHADLGELLLCEIVARSDTVDVDALIADFRSLAGNVIEPMVRFIDFQIAPSITELEQLEKRRASLYAQIQQKQSEYVNLLEQINREKERKGWSNVAEAWVALNFLLCDILPLGSEANNLVFAAARLRKEPVHPSPSWLTKNLQVGPVRRTDSCTVRMPAKSFTCTRLVSFCREVAAINHPGVEYAPSADKFELASKFDELFHRCGLKSYRFPEPGEYDEPLQYLELQRYLENLITAEMKYLDRFFQRPDSDSPSPATEPAELPPHIENIKRAGEAMVKAIEGAVGNLKSEGDNTVAKVGNATKDLNAEVRNTVAKVGSVTEELAEAAQPFSEIYEDKRLLKARADALKAGVPELVLDEIVRQRHLTRFPRIGPLMKSLESSGGLTKLKNAGHGSSRARIANWLRIVRKIMVKSGLVDDYRVRSARPGVQESKLSENPPVPEDILSPENERHLPDPDNCNQELGGDVERQHKSDILDQLPQPTGSDPDWQELRPLLNEVMDELSDDDREVASLILEELPDAEIGTRLGLSEDKAHQRVVSVKAKLLAEFVKRNIPSTNEALKSIEQDGTKINKPGRT